MKQYVIAIALLLTLSLSAGAASQKHRHTPRTEQVDSAKNNHDAIEAFSDTTAAEDAEDDQYITYRQGTSYSSHDAEELREVLDSVGGFLGPTMALGIVAIAIVFLLAPLLMIIAIFYFVNKNRRQRYKLAEMAIQNGQPIPDQILREERDDWDRKDYNAGVRQMFTGIGVGIFLGLITGDLGYGIGALIFFVGLGKWFVARQTKNDRIDHNNSNNPQNMQNYD